MCFYRKRFKKLQDTVDELTQIVKTQELVRLREESKELKNILELLSNINIKVKSVKRIDGDYGTTMRVSYEVPTVIINFDEHNVPVKNNLFYSLNSLELISAEDMVKIQKVLNEIKENT